MSYSLDFRKRVMKIKKEKNLTFEKTSKRFGIGMRTLFRWHNRLEPMETRNKPATKVDMERLKQDVQKEPDAYLSERAERLGVSVTGIFYALRRLNFSNKKNSVSPKSRRNSQNKFSNKNKSL